MVVTKNLNFKPIPRNRQMNRWHCYALYRIEFHRSDAIPLNMHYILDYILYTELFNTDTLPGQSSLENYENSENYVDYLEK